MAKPKYDDNELALLNSKKAIKLLLQQTDHLKVDNVLSKVQTELEIEKLQIELIKLQTWVIEKQKKICILFEGRDAAGKGGAIRRITHHLNPRYYRVVALPKPTEQERGQWYFQRYINKLPNKGEIIFFDRSWYNRAIIEPVNDFCTKEEYETFMKEVIPFEDMLMNNGITLIKFWFSIDKEEQKKRFAEVMSNPLKRWKMTPLDEQAQLSWNLYTSYKDVMFAATNTERSPWIIIKANKKLPARIEAMQYILDQIPYKN